MTSNSVCFGLLFLPVIFGVSLDYLAPVLRSQSLNCQSKFHQGYCQIKCGEKDAICVKDSCFCLLTEDMKVQNDKESEKDDVIDYVDSGETEVQDQTRIDYIPIFALRPTVRHHIAHFCPNLDVARECIRKCMAQGKPAFCGKDHICYCGHKYSNKDKKTDVNTKAMYEQFRDLYAKYFGPDHSMEQEKDEQEKDEQGKDGQGKDGQEKDGHEKDGQEREIEISE